MQPSIELTTVAGLQTEVRRWGKGPPLLYLHPADGLAKEGEFLTALGQHFQVIAPSHPGFGNSLRQDDFKTVEDLAYFYLDFMAQEKLEGVILAGSSFGGWIALEIAIRSSARLAQMVLIDTVGVRFSDREKPDITDVYMLSDAEIIEHSYFDVARGKLDIANATDEELLIVSRNRVALCQYAWSPYMHNPRMKRWLHRVDVPTLVLWGGQDRIVSTDYGQRIADEITGARFVRIEDAGHYPHIEKPKQTVESIVAFSKNAGSDSSSLPLASEKLVTAQA